MNFITSNLRPSSKSPLTLGRGVLVFDEDGREFIDLSCQTNNMALGHCTDQIIEDVGKQMSNIWFSSSRFGSRAFFELSEKLVSLAPNNISAVNLKMCDGSDAVETAIKLARLYTRRREILVLKGAWHGETSGTLGLCSLVAKREYVVTEKDVAFSEESTLDSLKSLIDEHPNAAAVILDPAGVSNGVFKEEHARRELSLIRSKCTEKGIVLIFDEIQTFGGFFGTHLFASEFYSIKPDIICIGKALGAGLPLAATLCTSKMAGLLEYNDAEFTYGGQVLACVAGLTAIKETLREERRIADSLKNWITALELLPKELIEINQVGFITSITRKKNRFRDMWSKEIVNKALEEGLIVRRGNHGESILLKPPILIPGGIAERACLQLANIITEVEREISTKIRKHKIKNEQFADDLLQSLGPDFSARPRIGNEQEDVSRILSEAGVSVIRTYSISDNEVEYTYHSGESAEVVFPRFVQERNYDAISALISKQQTALEIAHANGIIVGNRKPRNLIVSGNDITLIDFDTTYEGDFKTLAAFEELSALLLSLYYIDNETILEELARRLSWKIVDTYGNLTNSVWASVRDFYLNVQEPGNLPLQKGGLKTTIQTMNKVLS